MCLVSVALFMAPLWTEAFWCKRLVIQITEELRCQMGQEAAQGLVSMLEETEDWLYATWAPISESPIQASTMKACIVQARATEKNFLGLETWTVWRERGETLCFLPSSCLSPSGAAHWPELARKAVDTGAGWHSSRGQPWDRQEGWEWKRKEFEGTGLRSAQKLHLHH
jgi:hypothetical protein